jgi:hypothetical protein
MTSKNRSLAVEPRRAFVRLLLAVTVLAISGADAFAQSTAFTYQGKLQDNQTPANGTYDLRFRLFDAASGGTQLGSTLCQDDVAVADGVFTVQLDFGSQFATTGDRYLEIEVRNDTGLDCGSAAGFVVLAPRQQLTGTPFAIHANAAFRLDASDGSPAGAVVVDAAGKVGVGTQTPGNQLDVISGFLGDGITLRGSGSNDPGYHLYEGTTDRGTLGLALHTGIWSTDASAGDIVLRNLTGKLLLQTGALGSGLAIVGSNVGLGTATPAAKLDVRGDIRLGPSGQYRAPAGEENLRIIRGGINYLGTILRGSGFTAERLDVGKYRITFNTPFLSTPSVTANTQRSTLCADIVAYDFTAPTPSQVVFVIYSPCAGDFQDAALDFIAIGPR